MLPLYNKEISVFGFFEAVWLRRPPKASVWYKMPILALIRHSVDGVRGHAKPGLGLPADGCGRCWSAPNPSSRLFAFSFSFRALWHLVTALLADDIVGL
jgi:hypothetical protein